MSSPNILLFISDQHSPYFSGFYGDKIVDTPNMDDLVAQGTTFDEAYTPCPICVPARAAMLSCKRASTTGVFTNADALSDLTPTFLHYLVEKGYETVLVGRMHFVGNDQRHGFTKRIAPDCTTISWARQSHKEVRGAYDSVYGGFMNTNIVGGGDSSSSYYDQYVIDKAIEYLNEPHDKPQFICVGVYSPHHPYVGPKDLYEKYKQRVKAPASIDYPVSKAWQMWQKNDTDEKLSIAVQSAYCAMIEQLDQRIGMVKQAFDQYCENMQSEKMFIYVSDHGDTVGDRKCYGKNNFYEKACKIPMIFTGDNIMHQRISSAVSIMDIGPTILDYAKAEKMIEVDGISLYDTLINGKIIEHNVYSEYISRVDKEKVYCLMLKKNQYKYICFSNGIDEALYDTVNDPNELCNLIDKLPEIANEFRVLASTTSKKEEAIKIHNYNARTRKLWQAYDETTNKDYSNDLFTVIPPEKYTNLPEEMSPYCTHYSNADFKR